MDIAYIVIAATALMLLIIVSIISAVKAKKYHFDHIGHRRYTTKNHLMTGAKKHCYQLFNELFGQKFYIIPDVQLSSILNHKLNGQSYASAKSFLNDKNIDFVFCNKSTLRPVCAVKLDDHVSENSVLSIQDVQRIFLSAHLPCIVVRRPRSLTRERAIEEFSRVIYETSKLG